MHIRPPCSLAVLNCGVTDNLHTWTSKSSRPSASCTRSSPVCSRKCALRSRAGVDTWIASERSRNVEQAELGYDDMVTSCPHLPFTDLTRKLVYMAQRPVLREQGWRGTDGQRSGSPVYTPEYQSKLQQHKRWSAETNNLGLKW